MNLDIYRNNLTKLSDKELADESKRIAAIKKTDMEHGKALQSEWYKEFDKRHPMARISLPIELLVPEQIVLSAEG
jgi:hypothetical protein